MSPTRMAVWDRRVGKSLKAIGRKPKGRRHHYKKYLEIVVDLAQAMQETVNDGHTVIPREVDLALYHAAGRPEVLEQLRHAASET